MPMYGAHPAEKVPALQARHVVTPSPAKPALQTQVRAARVPYIGLEDVDLESAGHGEHAAKPGSLL